MSLLHSLLQAVRSWRRRRTGTKPARRSEVALERLDHRQLLNVDFTGIVKNDFPPTMVPGVVYLEDNPAVRHPVISPLLEPIVKVSGLDITGIAVTYDPTDDTLNLGLLQPDNQKTGQTVIAGDTDNNLNSATVDPAVLAVEPDFKDFPDLQGSETMGAILDLNNDGVPDIVAGISNDPGAPKVYQVANAVVNPSDPANTIPGFGVPLPQNTGNVYLVNDPRHGAFEFSIAKFSQLYQSITGQALSPQSTVRIGAFGNSADDIGISEAFFPPQPLTVGNATPTPKPPCPPYEPPILINPHQKRHINTAHPTDVRVNILGSAGFDVTQIDPATVRLGGATPIFDFTRRINRDKYLDATYVFRGSDITLPPGITDATVTGKLFNGADFVSTFEVFNRDASYYTPKQIARQEARQEKLGSAAFLTPLQRKVIREKAIDKAIQERSAGTVQALSTSDGNVVRIPFRADNGNGEFNPGKIVVNMHLPTVPDGMAPVATPSQQPKPANTVSIATRRGGQVKTPRVKVKMSNSARSSGIPAMQADHGSSM